MMNNNPPSKSAPATVLCALCVTVSMGTVGCATGVATAAPAASSAEQATADQIASQIQRVAPAVDDARRIAVHWKPGSIEANTGSIATEIPQYNAGWVRIQRRDQAGDSELRVGLPLAALPRAAVVAKDGTVTFQRGIPATDVAVQVFDQGVRVLVVLNDRSAPTEISFPVNVPAGGTITPNESGGLIVTDLHGALVGGFDAPWAHDADNRAVATHYDVRGQTVVQVIEHTSGDLQYPVVADQWLFKALISSAKWRFTTPYGWTLMVTPTRWARSFPGFRGVGEAGWNELYSKYKTHGLTRNLNSMRNQFICHQVVVAVHSPRKPTWDIDEWRPNVGFLQTVNHKCNPGPGGSGGEI